MLEIGLFHNGASSLPVITSKNGVTFNDGALPVVHRAAQETLVNQVRQGILAEKLGFQSFWLTEHHFQPEGAEMSPNPLMGPCCTDRSLGGEDWTVYQRPVPDPGQSPCHSKRTKIAVTTSRSSGTE